jgi:hypothetical protein
MGFLWTCTPWIFPQAVQRRVQCSKPDRPGATDWTLAGPSHCGHNGRGMERGGDVGISRDGMLSALRFRREHNTLSHRSLPETVAVMAQTALSRNETQVGTRSGERSLSGQSLVCHSGRRPYFEARAILCSKWPVS